MTSISSASISMVNAQRWRAQAFLREISGQPGHGRVERKCPASSLGNDQRNQFYGVADSLSQDDDLAGMTVHAKQAVQAYRCLGMEAKHEQISTLLGVDEYA